MTKWVQKQSSYISSNLLNNRNDNNAMLNAGRLSCVFDAHT